MYTFLNRRRPARAAIAGAMLLGLAAPANAALFSFDFNLTVVGLFNPSNGAPASTPPLIGSTGTASVSFDIDTSGLAAGDVLDLFNDDVDTFTADIFGQIFDETETTNVTSGPFGPGDTPLATLIAGADITTDPLALSLAFFGFGVSEIASLTTLAGVFTYAPDSLTQIDEPFVVAFSALFAAQDEADRLVSGDTGEAAVNVGVVPVPPALAMSATAFAGFAAFGRRRRAAA